MIDGLIAVALTGFLNGLAWECPTLSREQAAAITRLSVESTGHQRDASMFDEVVVPEGDWRSPAADAPVILRVVAPPGGGHSNTIWTVVWREADGSWWFWRQDRHSGAASPPERPPEGTPEYEAHMARWYGGPLADVDRWPPEGGRLSSRQARLIDAALSDPCREAAEPFRSREGPATSTTRRPSSPPPAPDSSAVHVQITEAGSAPRYLGAYWPGDVNRIPLISAVAWPQPE